MNDPLVNPKDPIRKTGPDRSIELFRAMSKLADGHGTDEVINAAVNVLVNALRHTYPTRRDVERRFDELFGKTKQTLLDHYDATTGRRRSVFAFDQVIRPELFVDKDDFRKH